MLLFSIEQGIIRPFLLFKKYIKKVLISPKSVTRFYCGNNPVNWIDPLGLSSPYPCLGAGSGYYSEYDLENHGTQEQREYWEKEAVKAVVATYLFAAYISWLEVLPDPPTEDPTTDPEYNPDPPKMPNYKIFDPENVPGRKAADIEDIVDSPDEKPPTKSG